MEESKRKTTKEFNPLRKEVVNVEFVKQQVGMVTDPKSPLYGGLSQTSTIFYTVPLDERGNLKQFLTPEEQAFLEKEFGMQEGALSIYRTENNYWTTYNKGYINRVALTKIGKKLDLSNVVQWLEYKILQANTDYICPDMETLEHDKKETYRFVMNNEQQKASIVGKKADLKFDIYDAYGKIKEDANMLRTIAFLVEKRKISPNTKLELIKDKIVSLIDERTNDVYDIITNKNLEQIKTLIIGVEKNIVNERNGFYYLADNGQRISNDYEEPTLYNAAAYLANPENQELYFNLSSRIK